MHRLVTAEAVIYPVNQATIVPKISAPVRQFYVQRGDHVKQGQLWPFWKTATCVPPLTRASELYQQAQANLEHARPTLPDDLTKAQSDLAAAREGLGGRPEALRQSAVALLKEGALAQKLVDDAKVALVQAQSQSTIPPASICVA